MKYLGFEFGAGMNAADMKVKLGGVDISRICSRVEVVADAKGDFTRVSLFCIQDDGKPAIINGLLALREEDYEKIKRSMAKWLPQQG